MKPIPISRFSYKFLKKVPDALAEKGYPNLNTSHNKVTNWCVYGYITPRIPGNKSCKYGWYDVDSFVESIDGIIRYRLDGNP